jgi:hypothetical protein
MGKRNKHSFGGHSAAWGATDSGKTWLMKRHAAVIRRKRLPVIVCSPVGVYRDWPRGVQFVRNAAQLEQALRKPSNRRGGCFGFVDEAGDLRDELERFKWKYPLVMSMMSRGRHWGFTGFISSQYPRDVIPKWRRNASKHYCFRLGDEEAAKIIWKDAGCPKMPDGTPAWRLLPRLKKLQCVIMESAKPTARLTCI